ncbi:MAG TPA: TetR/AcrR family transcriptional regulator [Solirubrobacteraceae bacterium]|nr:TetR/AcrR family transcriptional regulator [Solirubrobacteraceae bacterium]
MPYRPTARTEARRAEVRERIVRAALELVRRGGYRAASVAAVAARARVATGTVYRHFPSKSELFAEVFRVASQHEVDAVAEAMASPGAAVDRIAAGVETFARRALRGRRLAWALLAEPVDPAVEAERLVFRRSYASLFSMSLREGVQEGSLPPQDPSVTAVALVGAIGEVLTQPHDVDDDVLVASLVQFCLRSITDTETGARLARSRDALATPKEPHVHHRAA